MKINTLTIQECKQKFDMWITEGSIPTLSSNYNCHLDDEYSKLRDDLLLTYNNIKKSYTSGYGLDYRFAIWIYEYMSPMLTYRDASNEGFWRYIAFEVIPDIITDRFMNLENKIDSKHFYSKGTRIYPYSLYWYALLSWQGNKERTQEILDKRQFTTDMIVGLVERTGRNGTYIKLYRSIVKYFGGVTSKNPIDYRTLFRSVMKLCNAKTPVVDPDLCQGGPDAYAQMLMSECCNDIDFSIVSNENV